jgi:hypothetical protein
VTYKSRNDPVEPVADENGDEHHPAFGMMSAHRVRATPGVVLFDSDIRHGEYIEVTLTTATRKRDLKHDWIHPGRVLFKADLSLAQFASFVSSTDTSGVPVTVSYTETAGRTPDLPYAPRLEHSMNEAKGAAREAFSHILAALEEYEAALDRKAGAAERRAALRDLRAAVNNAPSNVDYAGKQLAKLAEDVVAKARADIEAMVQREAAQRAITAESPLELPESV